jgi:O-antigen ligase
MTNNQQIIALDRKTNLVRLLIAIRALLELISQGAALSALSVLVWNRNRHIDWPGFDKSNVPFSYMLPSVRLVEVVVGLSIAAYLLSGWPNFAHLKRGAPKIFALSLVGLWLLTILSASWSMNSGLAISQAGHLAIWILFALMIACADWPVPRLVAFFLGGILLQSAVGLIQFVTQHFVGLPSQVGELPVKPEYTWVSVVFDGPRRLMRAYALSGHPNILGGHVAIGVILSYGLIVVWPRIWRALAVLAWAIIWVLLLITFSRSAWLATAIGVAAAFGLLLRGRLLNRRAGVAMITLAVIGLILAVSFAVAFRPFLVGRVDTTAQPLEGFSILQRGVMIDTADQLIMARPLTGVGAANYISAASALVGYPLDWVHNVALLVASELGLPGFALFTLMICTLLAVGIRRWRQRSITLWQALMGGTLLGMLPILLFDHYLWTDPQGTILFALVAGLWLREEKHSTKDKEEINIDN